MMITPKQSCFSGRSMKSFIDEMLLKDALTCDVCEAPINAIRSVEDTDVLNGASAVFNATSVSSGCKNVLFVDKSNQSFILSRMSAAKEVLARVGLYTYICIVTVA